MFRHGQLSTCVANNAYAQATLLHRRLVFIFRSATTMVRRFIPNHVLQHVSMSTLAVMCISSVFLIVSLSTIFFLWPSQLLLTPSSSTLNAQPNLSLSLHFATHPFFHLSSSNLKGSKTTYKHDTHSKINYVYNNSVLTTSQRARHILRRLSYHQGYGKGFSSYTHVTVSLIGIFGMFSAIIGALLAPWLVEAGNIPSDDDRFIYWVRPDDDDEGDEENIFGPYREEKFHLLRLLDVS